MDNPPISIDIQANCDSHDDTFNIIDLKMRLTIIRLFIDAFMKLKYAYLSIFENI